MKKRLIALIAVLAMSMAIFAACGGSGAGEENGKAEGTDGGSEKKTEKIAEFTTVDLNGNEVTQAIFADVDITMINFWGTYCAPCIKELPDLQKISGSYDGRFQMIGVPIDVNFSDKNSAEYKNALKYLEQAGADYMNIEAAGGIVEYMSSMQYVPTSIFVDSEGNLIGEPVVGALTDEYKKRIEDYLNGKS
ncbi:MAG: TlpA family protein disulfide reductase [Mogibacterium sp.]|nr:TlpA family protein disulfide reductase [Mogibacterium sp.]